MFTILLWAVVVGAVLAVAAFALADVDRKKIVGELAIVFFALVLFEGWGSYFPAHVVGKASAVNGYHQFLNGTVIDTPMKKIPCERDGECANTYKCDVTYTTEFYQDSEGKTQTRQVEHSHQCPYATYEYSYWLLVEAYHTYHIPVALNIFDARPQQFRGGWSGEDVPRNIARGVPKKWQLAKDAIARGDAPSATVPDTYANYILANELDSYEEYSDKIEDLKAARLLPDHTARLKDPIYDLIVADKVSFVGGCAPTNPKAWQDEAMRFNSSFGPHQQGDLHIVCLKASALNGKGISPFDYTQALKANWLNGLGKYAFPKNGVALVLAVSDDGQRVQWSRAFTGMPKGNEGMLNRLSEFEHRTTPLDFTPTAVLGHTTTTIIHKGGEPQALSSTTAGAVPDIVMGGEFEFIRACMDCDDKGEDAAQGYVSLKDEIPLSTTWTVIAIVANTTLSLAGWWVLFVVVAGITPPSSPRQRISSSRRRPSHQEQVPSYVLEAWKEGRK